MVRGSLCADPVAGDYAVIDVSRRGANHVQVFHMAGLSVHSVLLTVNEALELMDKLKRAVEEERELETLVPDD